MGDEGHRGDTYLLVRGSIVSLKGQPRPQGEKQPRGGLYRSPPARTLGELATEMIEPLPVTSGAQRMGESWETGHGQISKGRVVSRNYRSGSLLEAEVGERGFTIDKTQVFLKTCHMSHAILGVRPSSTR